MRVKMFVKKGLGMALSVIMALQLIAAVVPTLTVSAEIMDQSKNQSRELKVKGNKIVLADDEDVEVVLRGVNLESSYDHPTMMDVDNVFGDKKKPGQLDYIMNTLGGNLIRITVNVKSWLGKFDGWDYDPTGETYRNTIDKVINEISRAGKYAVLDMHAYHRFDSPDYLEFWDTAAERYKNNPTVLFGILNEPTCDWDEWLNGDATPGDVNGQKSVGHQYMVERIRATGARNIIIAGGPSYSGTLAKIGTDEGYDLIDRNLDGDMEKSGNGIMYDYHRYMLHGSTATWIAGADAARKKYPILMGEFGWQDGLLNNHPKEGSDTWHTNWFPAIFDWMNDYETYGNYCNWTAFAFHPTAGPPMLVNKDNWYLDFELNDVFGKYIKEELDRLQSDSSLTKFKVPAVSSTEAASDARNATDGDPNTAWISGNDEGDKTLEIDLGSVTEIKRWYVRHAPLTDADKITSDFKLQYKVEKDDEWQDADSVTGNAYAVTDRFIHIEEARYVRLVITKPDQSSGNAANIYEFNVMGESEPEEIVPIEPPASVANGLLVSTGRKFDADSESVSGTNISNFGGVWYRDANTIAPEIVDVTGGGKALHIKGNTYQVGITNSNMVFGDVRNIEGFNFRLKSTKNMSLRLRARFGPDGNESFPQYSIDTKTITIPSTNGEWEDVWVPFEDLLPDDETDKAFWQSDDAASLYRSLNPARWAPDGYSTEKTPNAYWPILIAFIGAGSDDAFISEIESFTEANGSVSYDSISFSNAGFSSNAGLQSGTTVISAKITNNTNKTISGAILAANLYKRGNTKVVASGVQVLDLAANSTSQEQLLSLTVPAGADPADYYIKLHLLSDRLFARPLADTLVFDSTGVADGDTFDAAEGSTLTIDPITQVDRGGEASITVKSTEKEPIGLLVYREKAHPDLTQDLLYIDQMTADTADFTFTVPTNAVSMNYKVAAGSMGSDMGASSSMFVTENVIGDTYEVDLSVTDTYTFPSKEKGYTDADIVPLTVNVANAGTGDAGDLTISKSGSGADKFTLSKGVLNVAAGKSDIFTIKPVVGIERPATYTATITVSGGEITPKSFNVKFGVTGDYTIFLTDVKGNGNTWGNGTKFNSAPNGDAEDSEEQSGKDGEYWFSLTGQSASYPQYKIGLPEDDYTGLKKVSFWLKATGDMVDTSYKLGLRSDSDSELASFALPSMTEEYVYCEYDVTDLTGQDFANLSELRVNFGNEAKTGSLYISQLKFYFVREGYGVTYTLNGEPVDFHQFTGAEVGYGDQASNALTVDLAASGVDVPANAVDIEVKGKDGTPDDAFTPSVSSLKIDASTNSGSFTLKPRTGLDAGDYSASVNIKYEGEVLASFDVLFMVINFRPNFVHIDNSSNANRIAPGSIWSDPNTDDYPGENSEGYITTSMVQGDGITLTGGSISNKTLKFDIASVGGSASQLDYENPTKQVGRAQKKLASLDYSGLADAEGNVYVSVLAKNVGETDVGVDLSLVRAVSKEVTTIVNLGALDISAEDTDWKQITYKAKLADQMKTDDIGYLGIRTRTNSKGSVLISDLIISNCPIDTIDLSVANGLMEAPPNISISGLKNGTLTIPTAVEGYGAPPRRKGNCDKQR